MGELDLDATGADFIDQRGKEVIDAIARVEGRVDEVNTDCTERVLLAVRVLIPKTKMENFKL